MSWKNDVSRYKFLVTRTVERTHRRLRRPASRTRHARIQDQHGLDVLPVRPAAAGSRSTHPLSRPARARRNCPSGPSARLAAPAAGKPTAAFDPVTISAPPISSRGSIPVAQPIRHSTSTAPIPSPPRAAPPPMPRRSSIFLEGRRPSSSIRVLRRHSRIPS